MYTKKSEWWPFEQTREFIRSLQFNNPKEFKTWAASRFRNPKIPSTPHRDYPEFTNYSDFLGTKNTYEEAREKVKHLNLKTRKDYVEYINTYSKIRGVPKQPNKAYKEKGWVSWSEFLSVKD